MKNLRIAIFILLIGFASSSIFAQIERSELKPCSQDKEEKLQLLRKAEDNQYHIRHIYFVGKQFTSNRTFRKYLTENFNEGYAFTQNNLIVTIDKLNKFKKIKHISLDNVKIRLEKDEVRDLNVIDFDICVEQKRK